MIFIGLGANLTSPVGSPQITLTRALGLLAERGIRVRKVSPYYSTPAWPDPNDPSYVNAVAAIVTPLAPKALLQTLHEVEANLGRVRSVANAPRTLDLDLLDYEGRVDDGPPILPHPRIAERAFVLVPLSDIAPQWSHPQTGKSLAQLLEAIPADERGKIVRLSP